MIDCYGIYLPGRGSVKESQLKLATFAFALWFAGCGHWILDSSNYQQTTTMAADEDTGGNAPRRGKRTTQPSSANAAPNTTAGDGGGQQQQEQQEEMTFLPILNWLVFFFVMQNIMTSVMTKFGPQPGNDIPASPLNNDIVDVDNVVTGADVSSSSAGHRQKGKPLGASSTNTNTDNHKPKPWMKQFKPSCLWQQGTVMDLDVVITDSPFVPTGWPELTTPIKDDDAAEENNKSTKVTKTKGGKILASWSQDELILGGVSDEPNNSGGIMSFISSNANQEMNHRNTSLTIPMTSAVWNNQTHIYAYVKLQRRRHYKDGSDSRSNKDSNNNKRPVKKDDVLVKRMTLTRYRKRKKMRDVKSLLPSNDDGSKETNNDVDPNDTTVLTAASLNKTHDQLLVYMKPSLTLQIVDLGPIDFPTKDGVPAQFNNHMDWIEQHGHDFYYPILYPSEFWITYRSLKEVNGTLKESKLDVTFEPTPVSWFEHTHKMCLCRFAIDHSLDSAQHSL